MCACWAQSRPRCDNHNLEQPEPWHCPHYMLSFALHVALLGFGLLLLAFALLAELPNSPLAIAGDHNSPLAIAGDRQEPPVSSHKDQGAVRAATAAAEPPLLPGACVTACCSVRCPSVTLLHTPLSCAVSAAYYAILW